MHQIIIPLQEVMFTTDTKLNQSFCPYTGMLILTTHPLKPFTFW